MPLYRNNQASTINLNDSFSAKQSGDRVIFNKGNLFSDSGFQDFSFLEAKSGEVLYGESSEYLIGVGVSSSLLSTGIINFKSGDLGREIENQDRQLFFTKNQINNDLLFLKNSGETPTFNCYLTKSNDGFYLNILNGRIEQANLIDEAFFKRVFLEKSSAGQSIFYLKYDSSSEQLDVENQDEMSFSTQTSYEKDNSLRGEWDFSNEYTEKIPLCVVDFDRVSVSLLQDSVIDVSRTKSSMGINGKGYSQIA